MAVDQGQTNDVAAQHPDIVEQMVAIMAQQKDPNYTGVLAAVAPNDHA